MNFAHYTRDITFRIRKIDSVFYLVSPQKCYEVNEIAVVILKTIGKNVDINQLVEKISLNYKEDDIERIKKDVFNFVDFLINNNIIIKID